MKESWSQTRTCDLDRFMQTVRQRVRNNGVPDPENARHIVAMSRLLSTRPVHGQTPKSITGNRQTSRITAHSNTRRLPYGSSSVSQ